MKKIVRFILFFMISSVCYSSEDSNLWIKASSESDFFKQKNIIPFMVKGSYTLKTQKKITSLIPFPSSTYIKDDRFIILKDFQETFQTGTKEFCISHLNNDYDIYQVTVKTKKYIQRDPFVITGIDEERIYLKEIKAIKKTASLKLLTASSLLNNSSCNIPNLAIPLELKDYIEEIKKAVEN